MPTKKSTASPEAPAPLPRTPISAWEEIRLQIEIADEAMHRARQVLDAWFTLAPPAAWRRPFDVPPERTDAGGAQS